MTCLFYVSFKDGGYKEALAAFYTEIERFKRYGITEGELERAKMEIEEATAKIKPSVLTVATVSSEEVYLISSVVFSGVVVTVS